MCPFGIELHKQYEIAEKERSACARHCVTAMTLPATDKQMVAAKQRYVETFADWLSHRAFCQDCKPGAPAPQQRVSSLGR